MRRRGGPQWCHPRSQPAPAEAYPNLNSRSSDPKAWLRWQVGFLFCTFVSLTGKIWYWLETGRLSTVREIKRLELLVAHLAADRLSRPQV